MKTGTKGRGWTLLWMAGAAALPAAADGADVQKVGELGDPARLRFEGVAFFDPGQVRSALRGSAEFHLAGYPGAPVDAFRAKVEELVERGYRHAGFPQADAKVRVGETGDTVVVTVDEGRRYSGGGVRLSNAGDVSPDGFEEVLIELSGGFLDGGGGLLSGASLGLRGSTASFNPGLEEARTRLAREAFEAMGYFGTELEVELVPDPDRGVADWVVTVVAPGSELVATGFYFFGLQGNTAEAVLATAGLAAGKRIERRLLDGAVRRLEETGRFNSVSAGVGKRDGDGGARLNIKVKERLNLPPLGEDLSDAQQVILRFSGWVAGWRDSQDDVTIVYRADGEDAGRRDLRFVVSPLGGGLARIDPAGAARGGAPEIALVVSDEVIAAYDGRAGEQLVLPNLLVEWYSKVAGSGLLRYTGSPLNLDLFGVPVKSLRHVADGLLAALASGAITTEAEGGAVRFGLNLKTESLAGFSLLIDRESGRPIGGELMSGLELRVGRGDFSREVEALGRAAEGLRRLDPEDVIGSAARMVNHFLSHPWQRTDLKVGGSTKRLEGVSGEAVDKAKALRSAVDKVLAHQPVRPLMRVLGHDETGGEAITIPLGRPKPGFTSVPGLDPQVIQIIEAAWFEYLYANRNELFPVGSWPHVLIEKGSFILSDYSGEAREEIGQFMRSGEAGPLALAVVNGLLAPFFTDLRQPVAPGGLQHFSSARFRRDLRPFLDGQGAVPECGRRLLAALADMDQAEISAVVDLFQGGVGVGVDPMRLAQAMGEVAQVLKSAGENASYESVAGPIDRLWKEHLLAEVAYRQWASSKRVDPGRASARIAFAEAFYPFGRPGGKDGKEAPGAGANGDAAAGRELAESIRFNPWFVSAYGTFGDARSDKGEFRAAISFYDRVLALDPKSAYTYHARGLAKHDLGEIPAALGDFNRAIGLDPMNSAAFSNRGNAKHDLGDIDGALADYGRAIELDPSDADTYYNRGFTLRSIGDLDGAFADFDRATRIKPEHPWSLLGRGDVRSDKGDYDGALADYGRALELDPKDPSAWRSRGHVHLFKREWGKAVADYRRGRELVLADKTGEGAGTNDEYAALFTWGASSRSGNGEAADRALASRLGANQRSGIKDPWPRRIAEFLLGRVSEQELLAMANSPGEDAKTRRGRRCEAFYFVAVKRLLGGDKPGAVDLFRQCLATGKTDFIEFQAARSELGAMGE